MKKIILTALGLMLLSVTTGCSARSSGIGIIGGADGPTAVFVTGNPVGLFALLAGIAAVVIVLIWWFRRKR